VLISGQLSVDRTEAQIASHAKGLVQKAGQDWDEALRRVIHHESRHKVFKRKMPFSKLEQLRIASFYLDVNLQRNKHQVVTARMLQWYRDTGNPNQHDLLMEGTGSGTYHEKIKNHHRNNIEQRYKGDVRAAIRECERRLASEDNGASRFSEFSAVPRNLTRAASPEPFPADVHREASLPVRTESLPVATDVPMVSYPHLMDTLDLALTGPDHSTLSYPSPTIDTDAVHWNLLSAIDPLLESSYILPLDTFPEFPLHPFQPPAAAPNSAPTAPATSSDPAPTTYPSLATFISPVTTSFPPSVVVSSSVMTLPSQAETLLTSVEGNFDSILPAGKTPLTNTDFEYFGSLPSYTTT
jgi:hypothetical protein